jgi:hypothetical protein
MYTQFSRINDLRTSVTQMPATTTAEKQEKRAAYLQIYVLSRNSGYHDEMVEAHAFISSEAISYDDYTTCMVAAEKRRDIASYVSCKKALGQCVTAGEAQIIGLTWSDKETVQTLLNIIRTHVPTWKLSPEEWILVNAAAKK